MVKCFTINPVFVSRVKNSGDAVVNTFLPPTHLNHIPKVQMSKKKFYKALCCKLRY